MSKETIFILGGHQTDFARNFAREGLDINDLVADAVQGCLADSKVRAESIDVAHVGNFVGDRFTGQALLAGVVAESTPELRGIAISRHEAACASGSMAILAAMADLEAGRYSRALVLGVEFMRNVSGQLAADHLATAAWAGKESQDAQFMWPAQFSRMADEYAERYGLDESYLSAISRKNLDNAKRNPRAQTRNWSYDDSHFSRSKDANPVVEGRIRRYDCSQITDGAAAVVLANAQSAREYAADQGISIDQIPTISGWGHRTARISAVGKFQDSQGQELIFSHVNQAICDAQQRAGLTNSFELSGIETHDCFSMSEYMALDHFGLTPPGQSWQAIEQGLTAFDGKLPVNASGGLIGQGHPVGATGVRMLLDGWRQVSGRAGEYQIENAKNIQTLNIGGSTTAVASFIISR